MRTISYGGGVQSTAMIVLAVQGQIPGVDAALFANVGDKSEDPATLDYVRNIATPWAASRGLPVVELRKTRKRGERAGETVDLWDAMMEIDSRRLPIPVRMSNGAPGTRSCTAEWKIKVIGSWLRVHGATANNPAEVLIGISTDELQRAGRSRDEPYEHRRYPLLELGLSRADCMQVIERGGLPVPPKSSCFFCPFHRPSTWAEMRRDRPELFQKSQHLEDVLNERRVSLGKDPVFLTGFGKRLSDAITEAQPSLFDQRYGIGETGCDEGVCFV